MSFMNKCDIEKALIIIKAHTQRLQIGEEAPARAGRETRGPTSEMPRPAASHCGFAPALPTLGPPWNGPCSFTLLGLLICDVLCLECPSPLGQSYTPERLASSGSVSETPDRDAHSCYFSCGTECGAPSVSSYQAVIPRPHSLACGRN